MRLVVALAASTTLAGCTISANGTPRPSPDIGTGDSATEAPRVENPLDAAAFLAAPCSTLSADQLATFEVDPPGRGRDGDGIGPRCSWHGANGSIGVGFLTGNTGGLSDTYRGRELEAYFEVTTVDGYPAVFVDDADLRPRGNCGLVVGVSDTLAIDVLAQGSLDAEAACARAKRVAAAVIATMRVGA
jgi:uncharacterized protein DUF3558